jgi:hypothetical protein
MPTHAGWRSLAAILDRSSTAPRPLLAAGRRRGVGGALDPRREQRLVRYAVPLARPPRRPGPGRLQHADQGSDQGSPSPSGA